MIVSQHILLKSIEILHLEKPLLEATLCEF